MISNDLFVAGFLDIVQSVIDKVGAGARLICESDNSISIKKHGT
jgi:hypothetical protein